MRNCNHRRLCAWAGILIICLSLLLSMAASAQSFTASEAGIKYHGSYKLGATSTGWKKSLGSYTRKKYDGCTCGLNSYMYTFKSRGVKVETLEKKKGTEQIISIILSKKTVPTLAGLKVGDKITKMTNLYGTGYKKSGSTYKYTSGNYRMTVATNAKTKKITKITLLLNI